jgi:hypothetical protein
MKTSVSIGITSVIGWLTAAVAALPAVIQIIEEGNAAVAINGPTKWASILSVVSLAITQIGRYLQAHATIKAGGKA